MKKKLKKYISLFALVLVFVTTICFILFYNEKLLGHNKNSNAKIGEDIFAMLLDGEKITTTPNTDAFLVSYSCKNNSVIEWDRKTKKLSISKTNNILEECDLIFKSKPLLSEMKQGDYVKYEGNNGCMKNGTPINGVDTSPIGYAESGNSCLGYNANDTLDTDTYGYCQHSNHKFQVRGWRIAYLENGRAHLISAGSPECSRLLWKDSGFSTTKSTSSMDYEKFGSAYVYNSKTNRYTLSGTIIEGNWSEIHNQVIGMYSTYNCDSTNNICSGILKVTGYYSNSYAYVYYHNSNAINMDLYINYADNQAKKYCNSNYVDGDCSDNSDSWAIDDSDFYKMTSQINKGTGYHLNTDFGDNYCSKFKTNNNGYGNIQTKFCGYTNDLFDNGGYYWFTEKADSSGLYPIAWAPNFRAVSSGSDYTRAHESSVGGLRPIIRLSSTVYVTGGSGTMDDPYIIAN